MSRRKYNVIVAPEALAMLSEHVGFLANVSVKAAKQFQTDCFKNIKSLEEMPYRCPSFDKVNLHIKNIDTYCFQTTRWYL